MAPAASASETTTDRPRPSWNPFAPAPRDPAGEETTSLLDPPTPSPGTTSEADELLEPDSGREYDAAPEYESPAGTSSAGSTPGGDPKVANPLGGDHLKHVVRNGIIIATDQAHRLLAKTEGQLQTRLYAADDDDAAMIGDPLARIAARREGLGEVSPDTADLLAAMMGLAGYATKQIQKQAIARQIDSRGAETQTLSDLPEGDL